MRMGSDNKGESMTLNGHFAGSIRLIACAMLALFLSHALAPQFATAQPVPPPPAMPGLPEDQPEPLGPSPQPMTLDQAAPEIMLAPAPQGQGVIRRVEVQGAQRIEPDSVLSYLLLRTGQPYDAAQADRSLKVLFDTGLFADVRLDWDGETLIVRVVETRFSI